jgi:predicted lipoprotein with Yx(FWY)xxD motif
MDHERGAVMGARLRAVALGTVSAALLAGSCWGASAASAASHEARTSTIVFRAQHIAGVRGLVLVEGPGLVVYTYTGDRRGRAGTCKGECAAIWPPVRGVPVVARGSRIPGTFGRIKGQVTFNGLPLYGFTGEKPGQNFADGQFPVVRVP